ncbi:uncharacterized protein G2W53_041262 [Senna tora]|uniref:Uncharacterized protein n=1 Tax=Senna tora TaxID=362788 RepID=A0A834SFE9_9FABA|nr:uncharacterized protein G2W53_041262 [Senna tora]
MTAVMALIDTLRGCASKATKQPQPSLLGPWPRLRKFNSSQLAGPLSTPLCNRSLVCSFEHTTTMLSGPIMCGERNDSQTTSILA